MKIFLDTADLDEIRRAADAGLIDGITTNPSLVAKVAENRDVTEMYREICESVDGPVSLEVVALDRDTMVAEGRKLAAIHANAVVKLPLTEDGLKACRDLVTEGFKTNVTLCFSVSQALLVPRTSLRSSGVSTTSPGKACSSSIRFVRCMTTTGTTRKFSQLRFATPCTSWSRC